MKNFTKNDYYCMDDDSSLIIVGNYLLEIDEYDKKLRMKCMPADYEVIKWN